MIWILLAGILVSLVCYNLVRAMNYFKRIGVNQTKPWPLFGDNWLTFFKRMSFTELIDYIYNMYPNDRYSGFYQTTVPTLMLRDPELIKHITVKDFDHFTDHRSLVNEDLEPIWGVNLFSLRGEAWKEMRATLSGSYTSSKMKNMFTLMNEAAEHFVQYFIDKKQDVTEVEMKDIFTRYTNDVIATTAFGIRVDSMNEPNNMFYLMGKKLTNTSGFVIRIKYSGYILMPKLFKLLKVRLFHGEASSFFENIINQTIKMREEQGFVRNDMINLLLEARKGIKHQETDTTETGFSTAKESSDMSQIRQIQNLSNEDITAQALLFFFAGFETVSTVMCFGSYELAINKYVQDKMREEITETNKSTKGQLTYEALLKMKYLDMVISEILRKWPPVSGIDRLTVQPYTIEPITPYEKPVHLKRGDLVFLPIFGLHRDPAYFPDPAKFDPERFSDQNKESIKPYTYLPFGSGPRNCIASRFALLEIKALLFHLLLNFEIVPIKKSNIPLKLDTGSFNPTCEGGFWFGLRRVKND